MTDQPDTQPSPVSTLYKGGRRILFIMGIALIGWMILGPQLMPPRRNPPVINEITPPPPPPPPAAEAPPPEELPAPRDHVEAPPEPKPEHLAHLEEQLAKQQEMLAALQQQIGEIQSKSAEKLSALTAFGQMKDAILRGEPFASQLDILHPLVKDADSYALLDQLTPLAAKGIPTPADLQGQFARTIPAALAPAEGSHTVTRNLYSLIRIRKTGEPAGNDDEALIARAESRMAHGEIDGASKELSGLSPAAAEAFAPWMIAAKNRLSALAAVDALQRALVADK